MLKLTVRDYTYLSPLHSSYGRIDMLLTRHHDLSRVVSADIGTIFMSDHAQVLLSIDLLRQQRTPFQWKLNESLLQDSVTMAEVTTELTHYFSDKRSSDSSVMTI